MKKILVLSLLIFGTTTFTMSAAGVTIDDCVDFMSDYFNQKDKEYSTMMDDKDYLDMMGNDIQSFEMMDEQDIDDMPCH